MELVALLPVAALLALTIWQLAVAGYAVWGVAGAARAAARADAVGADPLEAARSRLPAALERGLTVRAGSGGEVAVSVGVPLVVGQETLVRVVERARLQPQDG